MYVKIFQNLTFEGHILNDYMYRKVPKFSGARKLCCYLPNIQTKRPKLKLFYGNYANEITNSEDPDQTAPLGAV